MRLGWWGLRAGRVADSVAAFKGSLAPAPAEGTPSVALLNEERDFAEAGLALALVSSGDLDGARRLARGLGSRRSALALPLSLRLAAAALANGRPADAQSITDELLAT